MRKLYEETLEWLPYMVIAVLVVVAAVLFEILLLTSYIGVGFGRFLHMILGVVMLAGGLDMMRICVGQIADAMKN